MDQPASGAKPCLTDRQIRDLAALGGRAEAHYGAPQDTEWAIDPAGKLWLTQSRPITTLYPVPVQVPGAGHAARREGTRIFLCFSLAQGLTRPLTPMGIAAFRILGSSVARAASFDVPDARTGPPPFAEAGQRIFIDLTGVVRSTVGRFIVPRAFDVMEARSAAVLRSVFTDPRFSITRRTPWGLLRRVIPVALRGRVPESLLRALLRPEAALRRVDRFTKDFGHALELPPERLRCSGLTTRNGCSRGPFPLCRPSFRCPRLVLPCWPWPENCWADPTGARICSPFFEDCPIT